MISGDDNIKSIQALSKKFLEAGEVITAFFESDQYRQMQNVFQKVRSDLGVFFEKNLLPLIEHIQKLPPATQRAVLLLAQNSWYIHPEMSFPEIFEFATPFTDTNIEKAERSLVDYFDTRLDEIEKSIVERFPNREAIIRSAFNAHRRQEYELSIPIFLAHTDGISKELMNQYLFIKRNGKPQTANYVDQLGADELAKALLSPLVQISPISAPYNNGDEDFGELNRHRILHGDSLNYATKTNSLKAISLLNYVANVSNVVGNNTQDVANVT